MKSFFAGLNFARTVILVMLVASAVLGWYVYKGAQRLGQVRTELARTPALVHDIQELSLQLQAVLDMAAKEGLKGQETPASYIRKIGMDDQVQAGELDVNPSTSNPRRDIVDDRYKIEPINKDRPFSRGMICNLLYKLEADSSRVKVTHVKIDRLERTKPGAIGADRWTFEAELTSRKAVEK